MEFKHEVSEELRNASKWDDDYSCWVTPDDRSWVYTDDPGNCGVSWRDGNGEPISVAVWLRNGDGSIARNL